MAGSWSALTDDFETVDANNTTNYPSTPMTDADNSWVGSRQLAAVDAQYYAALTDNFYRTRFNFDLTGPTCLDGPIRSIVHYAVQVRQRLLGSRRPGHGLRRRRRYRLQRSMSGAQDVVSHELSHAVTSCHSTLDYIRSRVR